MEIRSNSYKISSQKSSSPLLTKQRRGTINSLFSQTDRTQFDSNEFFIDLLLKLKTKSPLDQKQAISHLKKFGAIVNDSQFNLILNKFCQQFEQQSDITVGNTIIQDLSDKNQTDVQMSKDLFAKAKTFIQQGKLFEALPYLKQSVNKNPFQQDFRLNLSILYMKFQNFSDALKHLSIILNQNPSLIQAYQKKGDCLHALKKYEQALIQYRNGLNLEPSNTACIAGIKKATIGLINNSITSYQMSESRFLFQQIKDKFRKQQQISEQELVCISQLLTKKVLKFKK